MPDELTLDVIGRCPICSAELSKEDSFVLCPAGDYKATYLSWNDRWTVFDFEQEDAEKLLADLVALNLL